MFCPWVCTVRRGQLRSLPIYNVQYNVPRADIQALATAYMQQAAYQFISLLFSVVHVPSVKWFMASVRRGFLDKNLSVTSGSPSRIIKCTMIKLLYTIVQVESRRRFVRARKISPTPASPAWVATRICSTYFDLGAASCHSIWRISIHWSSEQGPGQRIAGRAAREGTP